MRRYEVTHRTEYRYDSPVSSSYGSLVLSPRTRPGQRIVSSRVMVTPEPMTIRQRTDHFGNECTYFEVLDDHVLLRIVSTSEVEVDAASTLPVLAADLTWELAADRVSGVLDVGGGGGGRAGAGGGGRAGGGRAGGAASEDDLLAREFAIASPHVPLLPVVADYGRASFAPGRSLIDAVGDLAARIYGEFAFEPDATDIGTTLPEVLDRRAGVCQDFTHLMIGCLRSVGLAARYVSGYLETLPPRGRPKLAGSDVSHAWVSVYIPGAGWLDIDPTNNMWVSDRHITTAWGRDYSDVAPVKGVIFSESRSNKLLVNVDVVALP